MDARAIGRELGVRYVMEGSVQGGGDRIRVNAQLIDTETGAHLWAERFDKPRADIFDMQDEITTRLARTVGIELIAAEGRRAERERPNNMDAVDLTMRGWAILNQPLSLDRPARRDLFDRRSGSTIGMSRRWSVSPPTILTTYALSPRPTGPNRYVSPRGRSPRR